MHATTLPSPLQANPSVNHLLSLKSLLERLVPCWHHRIGPSSAFPQQLQVSRTLSLLPPTFLSTKTNELTLNLLMWCTESAPSYTQQSRSTNLLQQNFLLRKAPICYIPILYVPVDTCPTCIPFLGGGNSCETDYTAPPTQAVSTIRVRVR